MAPNKRGGPPSFAVKAAAAKDYTSAAAGGGVISKEEVEARGSGTAEHGDTYDGRKLLKNEARVFFTGLMFLTRLPCPGWCDHHPAFLMRSMQWFPCFGALIGAWAAAFYMGAAVLWPTAIAVGISTFASVWLTGCFHEDGLADCFDGFGGGWGRVQILRIMKDSRVGTYALVGMSLVLYLKLQALVGLETMQQQQQQGGPGSSSSSVAAILVVAHAASRWSCIPLIYCCEYIQDDEDAKRGLYNWFAQSRRLLTAPRLLLGTASFLLLPLLLLGLQQAVAVWLAVVGVTIAAGYYGNAIIGGVVGDFLGATIQVSELAVYLVLLADWEALGSWQRAWPLALLLGVAAAPVIYSRRIVDFNTLC